MDLRLLPKLPAAKPQLDSFASSSYAAPVPLEEALSFYRHTLAQRGWQELVDQATPYVIPFQKDGFKLTLSPYAQTPTETLISLNFLSNYDLRRAPKLDQFLKQSVYEGDSSVIYKVEAKLLQIETELLRSLHQAGWTAIVRLGRSRSEEPDTRDLEFVKNGSVMRINVQPDRENQSQFVVSYGMSLTSASIPVPPDAGLMEWDDFLQLKLVANTSLSLDKAIAFYDDSMQQQGWVALDQGRRVDKAVAYLPYFQGQHDITVGLHQMPAGLVRIHVGPYNDDSWQTWEESDETSDEASAPQVGLEAADVPILHAACAPAYDPAEREIKFELEQVALKDLADQYTAAMKALGWKVKSMGEPEERNVNLMFQKESQTIYYQSSIDPREKGRLSLQGQGLLWNKAIASKSLVSYAAWLRNNRIPATLQRLDDFQEEMESLGSSAKPK
jgi:hypothetical protein